MNDIATIDQAGKGRSKSDRRKKTRDALVSTALRLIAEKGIAATSVLEVTETLGISNGTFYYHFQNKDQLLEQVGHALVIRLVDQIESAVRGDPAGLVARGPLVMLRYFDANPEMRAIILRVVEDPEGAHANLQARLREDIVRGQHIGRFKFQDIDIAVGFCRALMASAMRKACFCDNNDELAMLTSIHTLTMLGVPMWEAHGIAEQERDMFESENRPQLA